jgi:hypothetical protein
LGVSRCFPDNYSDLLKLKSWWVPQPRLLRFLNNEWFPLWRKCVSIVSLFWCRNWYCLGFCQEFAALAFELMPKDNPATNRRLWSSVAMRT